MDPRHRIAKDIVMIRPTPHHKKVNRLAVARVRRRAMAVHPSGSAASIDQGVRIERRKSERAELMRSVESFLNSVDEGDVELK